MRNGAVGQCAVADKVAPGGIERARRHTLADFIGRQNLGHQQGRRCRHPIANTAAHDGNATGTYQVLVKTNKVFMRRTDKLRIELRVDLVEPEQGVLNRPRVVIVKAVGRVLKPTVAFVKGLELPVLRRSDLIVAAIVGAQG